VKQNDGGNRAWASATDRCYRRKIRRPVTFKIANPLLVMFADEQGGVVCDIHPSEHCPTHETYGLLIANLVRHDARAFKVGEEDFWEWVDKERGHPTTPITSPS
jgi:hypothetical protein